MYRWIIGTVLILTGAVAATLLPAGPTMTTEALVPEVIYPDLPWGKSTSDPLDKDKNKYEVTYHIPAKKTGENPQPAMDPVCDFSISSSRAIQSVSIGEVDCETGNSIRTLTSKFFVPPSQPFSVDLPFNQIPEKDEEGNPNDQCIHPCSCVKITVYTKKENPPKPWTVGVQSTEEFTAFDPDIPDVGTGTYWECKKSTTNTGEQELRSLDPGGSGVMVGYVNGSSTNLEEITATFVNLDPGYGDPVITSVTDVDTTFASITIVSGCQVVMSGASVPESESFRIGIEFQDPIEGPLGAAFTSVFE